MKLGFVVIALTMASASAQADDLLGQGKTLLGTQGAAAPSMTGGLSGLPTDQIIDLVEKQGYSDISGLTTQGDVLKATGLNQMGSPVDLLIDPSTGNVLKALVK
jgi:peptidase YpeB-like protein